MIIASQFSARSTRAATVVVLGCLVAAVSGMTISHAQSNLPAGSPGRFTMHPADGGILRMDTQTGMLSMCKQSSSGWACTLATDDRIALTDEITRLKSENSDLKASVKRLEELAGVPGAQGDAGKQHSGIQLPTEEDVDKAMSYVERMLKKFKDKLKELESTEGKRGSQL